MELTVVGADVGTVLAVGTDVPDSVGSTDGVARDGETDGEAAATEAVEGVPVPVGAAAGAEHAATNASVAARASRRAPITR